VQGGVVRLTGAHNGMAALQAKAAGFEALYLSRAAMTASMGFLTSASSPWTR
jgi:methylisocitrate lyase